MREDVKRVTSSLIGQDIAHVLRPVETNLYEMLSKHYNIHRLELEANLAPNDSLTE